MNSPLSYLVAIAPSEAVGSVVDRYKRRYAKYTKYSIVPHVTLYPPFVLLGATETEAIARLERAAGELTPFLANFDSVGYFNNFHGNNVAYFAPDETSAEMIRGVFVAIVHALAGIADDRYPDYKMSAESYTPHMTIAERIPDEAFVAVKKELDAAKESLRFEVSSARLYVKIDGEAAWKESCEIPFGRALSKTGA